MNKWLPLLGAIASEVAATLSLKGALTAPGLYIVVALGYVAAFYLLSRSLRGGMALGVAYGIWGASGVALTAVLSWAIFGEPLTLVMIIGLVVIIGGVLTIELGAQAAHSKTKSETAS